MLDQKESTILVVDDIPANRRLLVKVLTAEGYSVAEANDGRDALQMVKQQPFDLIMSDINMPNMDGFELTQAIKADPANSHIPIILVTALTDQVSQMKGLESGAEDLLNKPVNLLEAKTKVRNLLRLKHAIDQLQVDNHFLAQYDSLTNLPNRNQFHETITQRTEEAKQAGAKDSLLIILFGIHNFRKFANVLSHAQQQTLIKHVAERLTALLPENSELYRYGESRFAAILQSPGSRQNIEKEMQRIQAAFQLPLDLEHGKIHMSLSMGVSILSESDIDADDLTRHAETALAEANNKTESNFVIYSKNLDANAAERLLLENELRHALERNQLSIAYQPKIDLTTGKINSMEALLRWEHSELGMIRPDIFIPIAEETGLILEIGEWVLETACRQCLQWRTTHNPELTVAVNLSPRQFLAYNVKEMVETALQLTGLPTNALELELTESCTMEDVEYSQQVLTSLNSLGIAIAIDDFGTGYSSLSYLTQLPVTHLKIDRTFIMEIPGNSQASAVASGIIALSHSLGLQVVAEGVETEEQLNFLREKACDIVQGYFISKPLNAAQFEIFMQDQLNKLAC